MFFNTVVGCVGIVSTALMISCGFVSEPLVGDAIGIPDPPILVPLGIIAYGIAANVCYTGGRIVELFLVKRGTLVDTNEFAVRAFRRGLKFSVGPTSFPRPLVGGVFGNASNPGDGSALHNSSRT